MSQGVREASQERPSHLTTVKEIILENFMSYEYARIPLREGLNLIVGPNGAGKSSVLLAISVAFGQAYTERSRKLSDLIRRGKEIARVSLVFDNSQKAGLRPIPYSKSDTFMLSRYLRRDGSYWFEADYKEIDKSEVVRLLREFGINPDNLLIIMHQGMIEELGAVTPQERLRMVEEAVGFLEYRQRIISAEQELSGLVGEESSLLQLMDNANQALEYWKQIYDRYQEKRRLIEHRDLLSKELLWSTEGRLSKSLQVAEEKISSKSRALDDLKSQQAEVSSDAEHTHQTLMDKQVELRKLYYALVRAESEKAKDESARNAYRSIKEDLLGLSSTIDELLSKGGDKNAKRLKELAVYIEQKSSSAEEDAGRRKAELDREVSSLQPEITKMEDVIRSTTDSHISFKVKAEVLSYRIRVTESDLRDLERTAREYKAELDKMALDLERAGSRMETARQPYEVSEELKLVSAHIQRMQDVPDDAEKIYNDYSGNIEELKVKLAKLQDNKKFMLSELDSRKGVWRKAMEDLVEAVDPPYQVVLSAADASGFVKLEQADTIEDAGLDLYVGFRGGAPTTLDPFTQSGGERSVALMAFILSLQARIVSPLRAMDEFDIHMDPKNREAMFKMILSQMKQREASQYIVITPSILTVFDRSAHVITVQAVHGSSEVKELK
ncbi:MAG: AAA family ATPase [Nitrososphaerota archaeon]|nr:AAA family ATPase [Nitrososphaerota archaeon]MDG6903361.1 AAA family ATPase [Nitrososphaerota archaeon]MDG6911777.1 AAA family ATPase [Nitrososphaerota archaeon]MDG6940741.1 AAA family ATPase [Nitrososphaerota archaeon]MDG6945654.1 AAA family ATPase [Nitrososphaerota archaeon]